MIKLLVCLLFAAAMVAANPVVETYLSEVGVDPAHQFVELRFAPIYHEPVDLTHWRIITSSSACTLTCQLGYGEFLVVDSEALAGGDVGFGAVRINPLGDSVMLVTDSGPIADRVYYPRYPTDYESAPLPPSTGSIAFWNYDDAEGQSMNWYVDSTPTPGWENDDYSSIAGTVTVVGGDTLNEVYVVASGTKGHCSCGLYQETDYDVAGLGAGEYEVTAYARHDGEWYEGTYPESVVVGYSQTIGGINIVIPVAGVAEMPSTPLLPPMRVSGRSLLLSGDGTAPVNVQLYNQLGSRVATFPLGTVNGERRVELPATLAPGVYFAEAREGPYRSAVKVALW
ncbi:MAG: hypothetical protein NTX53_14475 [candidate division WOR-3 bacterium]|nr:hypothetical protein [candidate division WOR-3 bacterium]